MSETNQSSGTNVTAPLPAIHLHGADATDFLNRLVISDLSQPTSVPFSGICNPKGRLLYTFWLLRQGDNDFLLFADPRLTDELKQFLSLRVFRSQVRIDTAPEWRLQLQSQTNGSLSAHAKPVIETDATNTESFLSDPQLWRQYWLWLMHHHLPWIVPQNQGLFIPQHLDLQHHGIVSVDKGCYPGQEIIARLHFLGKNKKHLYHVRFPDTNFSQDKSRLLQVLSNSTGRDWPLCDHTGMVIQASPAVLDKQDTIHCQMVASQPPTCLDIDQQKIEVSAQR